MSDREQQPPREADGSQAVSRFCDGFSCSQAILSSYAERYGMDEKLALRLAAGLGGGLGRMGGTCGALTGASLVLGLEMGGTETTDKAAKERTYDSVRALQERFAERHGSTQCRELLQCDISKPDDYQRAREQDLFKSSCPNFVGTAVNILDELLQRPDSKPEE